MSAPAPLAVPLRDAAVMLSTTYQAMYFRARRGVVPVLRAGGRALLVPIAWIEAQLAAALAGVDGPSVPARVRRRRRAGRRRHA